jgi:hypothetical protein
VLEIEPGFAFMTTPLPILAEGVTLELTPLKDKFTLGLTDLVMLLVKFEFTIGLFVVVIPAGI